MCRKCFREFVLSLVVALLISVLVSTLAWCVSGLGDMAVSNTIGSNVFDILVGLGVPWAIQTMCVDYGSEVLLASFFQSLCFAPPRVFAGLSRWH